MNLLTRRALSSILVSCIFSFDTQFIRAFQQISSFGTKDIRTIIRATGEQTTESYYDENGKESDDDDDEDGEEEDMLRVGDMQSLLLAQQEQIDQLMSRLNAQNGSGFQDSSSPGPHNQISALPALKVMLFIDGTWLYYSLYERQEIRERYGEGWQFKYTVDWSQLPQIVCRSLQEQEGQRGWSAMSHTENGSSENQSFRPIEVTRVSVYTSYKANTAKTSFRYRMFQDMLKSKYDMHMMETVGRGEKCIDIQLAVDMLHYATVPDAYDVALLLSGDKDYVPAMVRCRQKGRRIGVVSMRRGCNRALYETPNIKDFDIIWLEDHLEELLFQVPSNVRRASPYISRYTLVKIVADFITASGLPRVSARDIGKYIKTLVIADRCILDELKETYGGLYQFLVLSSVFEVDRVASVKQIWVGLVHDAPGKLREEADRATLKPEEEAFLLHHSLDGSQEMERLFWHTNNDTPQHDVAGPLFSYNNRRTSEAVEKVVVDYNSYTVVDLKELCRERKLPVSGRKAELIDRLSEYDSETSETKEASSSEEYLAGLITEYLRASGGKASSRDVGRYLNANKASAYNLGDEKTALAELKQHFMGVGRFVQGMDGVHIEALENGDPYDFLVCLNAQRM